MFLTLRVNPNHYGKSWEPKLWADKQNHSDKPEDQVQPMQMPKVMLELTGLVAGVNYFLLINLKKEK